MCTSYWMKPLDRCATAPVLRGNFQVYLATMVKSPKTELVRAGCIEDVEDCGTYTLRMREVTPTHTVVLLNGMVILRE